MFHSPVESVSCFVSTAAGGGWKLDCIFCYLQRFCGIPMNGWQSSMRLHHMHAATHTHTQTHDIIDIVPTLQLPLPFVNVQ